MKIHIIILILLLNIPLFSQTNDKIIIDRNYAQKPISIIEYSTDRFISGYNEFKGDIYKTKIIKFDLCGNITDSLKIEESDSYIFDLIFIEDNEIIITWQNSGNEVEDTFLWATKIDTNLKVIWQKQILNDYKVQRLNSKLIDKDHIIYYGGVMNSDSIFSSVLLEINRDGELLNSLLYGNLDIPVFIFDIIQKKDFSGYFLYQFNDSFLMEVDTNYTIKEKYCCLPEFIEGTMIGPNSNNCRWITDSSYVISGRRINQYGYDLALIIADSNHNTIYDFIFEENEKNDMVGFWDNLALQQESRNILFLGTLNFSFNQFENTYSNSLVLFSFDHTLNLNWVKTFGGDAYYNATNIIATKDNGCFIGATRSDNTNFEDYDLCFIKLDSNGNVISTIGEVYLNEDIFILFPNPASDILKIQKGIQVPEAEIVMYNSVGQTILRKKLTENITEIVVSDLQSGVYIYNIFRDGKKADEGKIIVE